MIDVDGSYAHRKSLESDVPDVPSIPLIGWEAIENAGSKYVDKIPKVTHGKC